MDGDQIRPSKHNPRGVLLVFDNEKLQPLALEYQRTGSEQLFKILLTPCERIFRMLIASRRSHLESDTDELYSRFRIKLYKSLGLFNPQRGSLFSFISTVGNSCLFSQVAFDRAHRRRYTTCPMDEILSSARHTATDELASKFRLDEIGYLARQVRTRSTCPKELAVQRWLVNAFWQSSFSALRHNVTDALSITFDRSTTNARYQHDIVLLELRRSLYSERCASGAQAYTPGYQMSLHQYRDYLSLAEFVKLQILMRGLAPRLIAEVKPANRVAFGNNDERAIQENLRIVLDGDPANSLLFSEGTKTFSV